MLLSLLSCISRPGIVIPVPPSAQEQLASADAVFQSRDYAGALPLYQALADDPSTPSEVRIEALAQSARMLSLTGDLEAGRGYLERALSQAAPEQPMGWTRTQGVQGIYQREDGDSAAALTTFSAAYTYAMEHALPLRAIDMAHHAALVAPASEQVHWAEKGITAALQADATSWLAVLYNNLGATYEELQDYPAALSAYREAQTYRVTLGAALPLLIADWAVAHAERLAQDPAARPDLEDVLERTQARYDAEPTPGNAEWLGYTLEDLALLTATECDLEQARVLMDEALARLEESGLSEHWPEKLDDCELKLQQWGSEL